MTTRISCLLTNASNALHHGERAANKYGGRSVW